MKKILEISNKYQAILFRREIKRELTNVYSIITTFEVMGKTPCITLDLKFCNLHEYNFLFFDYELFQMLLKPILKLSNDQIKKEIKNNA